MRAIGKSQLHRLGDDVIKIGRPRIHFAKVEVLENVEDLRHVHPA